MLHLRSFLAAAVLALPLSFAAWSAKAANADIVETAESTGNFGTSMKAVEAADLADTLKGEGPFTVFAPTDQAFAALPQGKLEALLKPENKGELIKVLSYHVVSGKITAAEIAGKSSSFETLEGSNVQVNSAGRVTKVNEAAITQPDVIASNGVIHVIDQVILPE